MISRMQEMKLGAGSRVLAAVTFLGAMTMASTVASAGETITGRVVGVSDGDTITVLDSTKTRHKIRLAGIDAPESKQAFGQASKKSLAAMVFDRDVTLDPRLQQDR